MKCEKSTAIVLAAGSGSRMNSSVKKQYLLIEGKPVLYYSLKVFEECPFISEVILVTGEEEIGFCQKEIIEKYELNKVTKIIAGGAERYHSVYEGLKVITESAYVYIHDGARPFIDAEILERAHAGVQQYGACVVAMPAKDTIKIGDENAYSVSTPKRDLVWVVQTPQVFSYDLIRDAYSKIMDRKEISVTDDAMVLEAVSGEKVKFIHGSYQNIKITTPEDLKIAEIFMQNSVDRFR